MTLERHSLDLDEPSAAFFDAGVPTSAFHFRTISFARSATSLLAFCLSLLTVTPILVSCESREGGSSQPGKGHRALLPHSARSHPDEVLADYDILLELVKYRFDFL